MGGSRIEVSERRVDKEEKNEVGRKWGYKIKGQLNRCVLLKSGW